jgi:epoxyqueuosine reductase QueG
MKNKIISIVSDYVNNGNDGKFDFTDGKSGYEQPLFGFASINDPIFVEYKSIIDERHLTPIQAFENKFGLRLSDGTVISIVLPLNEAVIKSNRKENMLPSVKWTLARTFIDDVFYKKIILFLIKTLNDLGYKAVSPYSERDFKVFPETNMTSTWSERHIAYAAGLGTFSINEAMITEKGIAVKFISVVTDLIINPSVRTAKNYKANCLFYATGKCGVCMKRCPALAITEQGHNKLKCYQYCYGRESKKLAVSRGAYENNGSGCGLCLTNVPCERKNPMNNNYVNDR